MRIHNMLLVSLALLGCRKEIVETYGTPWREEAVVSCTTSGYCYNCYGKCGYRWGPTCPGKQRAIVEVTPYTFHYDNEPLVPLRGFRREIIERLGTCKR